MPIGQVEELIALKQKPASELKFMSSIPSNNLPKISEVENTFKKEMEMLSSRDTDFPISKNSSVHQNHVNVIRDENSPQYRVRTLLSEGKKRKRRQSEDKNSQKAEDKMTIHR
ncbi:hypothetical protein Sjap_012733 [Stephania japonica]|uniref:Uncharacterized protein n=1 Tax=Stephania japonica TaxID=461633 RepID=A0AAP0P0M7_9MAGN